MAIKNKSIRRARIKDGIRKKIRGTTERPRLSVYRSNKEIYVQIIDDVKRVTLIGTSSRAKEILGQEGTKSDISRLVGLEIAKRAKEAGLELVVFDRNGFKFHGRVKALAEGAREGGLKF